MQKFWNPIRHFKSSRALSWVVLPLLFGGLFSLVDPTNIAHAASDNAFTEAIGEVAAILVKICTFFAMVTVGTVGEFMGTDFIAGDDVLKVITPMWVLIRNLTNISAILMIIFIAMANLFTFGNGSWSIKDKLPKLLLALVAINFSMVAIKIALDAVYVATVAIYSVSDSAIIKITGGDGSLESVLTSKQRCISSDAGTDCNKVKKDSVGGAETFAKAINRLLCPSFAKTGRATGDNCFFYIDDTKKGFPNKMNPGQASQDGRPGENLFGAFANYVMYLELLPSVEGAKGNVSNTERSGFLNTIEATLFSMIMGIAYSFGFIAILLALIGRMVFMWFVLILSPGMIGAQIMGINMGGMWEKAVSHLIMPIKIATVLTISFLMIGQLTELTKVGSTVVQNPDMIVLGPALSNMGLGLFPIVWKIATIFIFWMGLKWALDGNIAQGLTDKVRAGAEGLGGLALNGLKAAPLLPIPTGSGGSKKVGIGALMSLPKLINRQITEKISDQQGTLTGMMGDEARKAQDEENRHLKRLVENTKNLKESPDELNASLGEAIPSMHRESSQTRVLAKLEESGVSEKDRDKIESGLAKIQAGDSSRTKAEKIEEAFKGTAVAGVTMKAILEGEASSKSSDGDGSSSTTPPAGFRTINDPNTQKTINTGEIVAIGERFKARVVSNDGDTKESVIVDLIDIDDTKAKKIAKDLTNNDKKQALLGTILPNDVFNKVKDKPFSIKKDGSNFMITNDDSVPGTAITP